MPANVTGRVELPCADPARARESGQPLRRVKGLRWLGESAGRVRVEVPAGTWRFTAPWPD